MDANFYQPTSAQPSGVDYQGLARMLMAQRPQGQGGAPSTTGSSLNGLNQLAGAGVQMLARNQQMDANKAATALNGGVATTGEMPAAFSRFGSALSGLFGA